MFSWGSGLGALIGIGNRIPCESFFQCLEMQFYIVNLHSEILYSSDSLISISHASSIPAQSQLVSRPCLQASSRISLNLTFHTPQITCWPGHHKPSLKQPVLSRQWLHPVRTFPVSRSESTSKQYRFCCVKRGLVLATITHLYSLDKGLLPIRVTMFKQAFCAESLKGFRDTTGRTLFVASWKCWWKASGVK
jgi:hypothetical protein